MFEVQRRTIFPSYVETWRTDYWVKDNLPIVCRDVKDWLQPLLWVFSHVFFYQWVNDCVLINHITVTSLHLFPMWPWETGSNKELVYTDKRVVLLYFVYMCIQRLWLQHTRLFEIQLYITPIHIQTYKDQIYRTE